MTMTRRETIIRTVLSVLLGAAFIGIFLVDRIGIERHLAAQQEYIDDLAATITSVGEQVPTPPAGVTPPIPGPAGERGERGERGEPGPVGLRGLTGEPGPQGLQGVQGLIGPQGAVGPTGPRGDTGPVGPQGPQGPVGEPGPQGEVGPQGPMGDDAYPFAFTFAFTVLNRDFTVVCDVTDSSASSCVVTETGPTIIIDPAR